MIQLSKDLVQYQFSLNMLWIYTVFTLMSVAVLNDAYRNEKDANSRERILLVRRFRMDKKEVASVSEKEFHKW